MSLVQMIVADLKANGPQHSLATDANDNLLFDPVYLVSAVEPIGYGSVPQIVFSDIRVEKDDRDMSAQRRFELVEPSPKFRAENLVLAARLDRPRKVAFCTVCCEFAVI